MNNQEKALQAVQKVIDGAIDLQEIYGEEKTREILNRARDIESDINNS